MLDPAKSRPEREQKFQEYQGQADACDAPRNLIDDPKAPRRRPRQLSCPRLFAAWPPAYLEYRQRYMAFLEQDPTMPDKVDCLELRDWDQIVDSLAYVIDPRPSRR